MKTAHDLVEAAKKEIQEVPLDQADDAIKNADHFVCQFDGLGSAN